MTLPRLALVGLMAALAAVHGAPASASSDAGVRWTSFSESSTCAAPYTGTPIVSRAGALAGNEPILGPFGTYFGRTIDEVRGELVPWIVPSSDGRTVLVHRAARTAFGRVSDNLAAEASRGHIYRVRDVAAHIARTIGKSRQLSRHALGTAIDINPATNPYRDDADQLVTDMPGWYVDAWVRAGFCWGGSWRYSKDPMHFSWIGPEPGSGAGLSPRPPRTSERPYAVTARYRTVFGPLAGEGRMLLADVAGFGSLDVVRARPKPGGLVLDVSGARSGFGPCSVSRLYVPTPLAPSDQLVLGDVDGDSRSDVVVLSPDPSGTGIRSAFRADRFETVSSTGLDAEVVQAAIGDLDQDRRGDLWTREPDGSLTVWAGPTFTDRLAHWDVPDSNSFAVGDRGGDAEIELYLIGKSGDGTAVDVLHRTESGWTPAERALVDASDVVAAAIADEDGDGRGDIALLESGGDLAVAVGNSPTGRPVDGWWNDPGAGCDEGPVPLEWRGTFYDDDESVFEGDIEAIAGSGVTRGCDPPIGERFCPGDPVTRGQMAAFLVRAFDLPPSDDRSFADTHESVFGDDIAALAAAGVTRGCAGDRYCPDRNVTRAQMAAFLVRALDLSAPTDADPFVDDDRSIFESDIEALVSADITRGCNPPKADRFCPDAPVVRGEMAAFLRRATS